MSNGSTRSFVKVVFIDEHDRGFLGTFQAFTLFRHFQSNMEGRRSVIVRSRWKVPNCPLMSYEYSEKSSGV
jgi:hypothetical protein